MKKYFLIVVILFISTLVSYSQIKGGFKAGGNFSNILGPNSSSYKYKLGFHAGGFVEYDVNGKVFLQAEALYSLKGFLDKSTSTVLNTTSETNVKYTLAYVDIPLMINVHLGGAGYIGIGPQLSILTSVKWDGQNTISNPPYTSTVTISGNGTDGWNKVDLGVVFSVGAKYDSGIEFGLRAGYGISNVYNSSTYSSTSSSSYSSSDIYHNLVFSASLGYAFGGGGSGGDRYGHKYKKKH